MNNTEADYFLWQGIKTLIRPDWRVLRIEGDVLKGAITVGDRYDPIVQVRWVRCEENFYPEKWLENRISKTAAGQTSQDAPKVNGFTNIEWIRDLQLKSEAAKTVWWGYSESAKIQLEVLMTDICAAECTEWVIKNTIPSFEAFSIDEPWEWRIYSCDFTTPSGFKLSQKRLSVGDVTIELTGEAGARIMLRQIYPASLALSRRSLDKWSQDNPFLQRRRYKTEDASETEDCIDRQGTFNIPFPLGWIRPKKFHKVIYHNEELDRLFYAETNWRGGELEITPQQLLEKMCLR